MRTIDDRLDKPRGHEKLRGKVVGFDFYRVFLAPKEPAHRESNGASPTHAFHVVFDVEVG
jgi:hypothetical protein